MAIECWIMTAEQVVKKFTEENPILNVQSRTTSTWGEIKGNEALKKKFSSAFLNALEHISGFLEITDVITVWMKLQESKFLSNATIHSMSKVPDWLQADAIKSLFDTAVSESKYLKNILKKTFNEKDLSSEWIKKLLNKKTEDLVWILDDKARWRIRLELKNKDNWRDETNIVYTEYVGKFSKTISDIRSTAEKAEPEDVGLDLVWRTKETKKPLTGIWAKKELDDLMFNVNNVNERMVKDFHKFQDYLDLLHTVRDIRKGLISLLKRSPKKFIQDNIVELHYLNYNLITFQNYVATKKTLETARGLSRRAEDEYARFKRILHNDFYKDIVKDINGKKVTYNNVYLINNIINKEIKNLINKKWESFMRSPTTNSVVFGKTLKTTAVKIDGAIDNTIDNAFKQWDYWLSAEIRKVLDNGRKKAFIVNDLASHIGWQPYTEIPKDSADYVMFSDIMLGYVKLDKNTDYIIWKKTLNTLFRNHSWITQFRVWPITKKHTQKWEDIPAFQLDNINIFLEHNLISMNFNPSLDEATGQIIAQEKELANVKRNIGSFNLISWEDFKSHPWLSDELLLSQNALIAKWNYLYTSSKILDDNIYVNKFKKIAAKFVWDSIDLDTTVNIDDVLKATSNISDMSQYYVSAFQRLFKGTDEARLSDEVFLYDVLYTDSTTYKYSEELRLRTKTDDKTKKALKKLNVKIKSWDIKIRKVEDIIKEPSANEWDMLPDISNDIQTKDVFEVWENDALKVYDLYSRYINKVPIEQLNAYTYTLIGKNQSIYDVTKYLPIFVRNKIHKPLDTLILSKVFGWLLASTWKTVEEFNAELIRSKKNIFNNHFLTDRNYEVSQDAKKELDKAWNTRDIWNDNVATKEYILASVSSSTNSKIIVYEILNLLQQKWLISEKINIVKEAVNINWQYFWKLKKFIRQTLQWPQITREWFEYQFAKVIDELVLLIDRHSIEKLDQVYIWWDKHSPFFTKDADWNEIHTRDQYEELTYEEKKDITTISWFEDRIENIAKTTEEVTELMFKLQRESLNWALLENLKLTTVDDVIKSWKKINEWAKDLPETKEEISIHKSKEVIRKNKSEAEVDDVDSFTETKQSDTLSNKDSFDITEEALLPYNHLLIWINQHKKTGKVNKSWDTWFDEKIQDYIKRDKNWAITNTVDSVFETMTVNRMTKKRYLKLFETKKFKTEFSKWDTDVILNMNTLFKDGSFTRQGYDTINQVFEKLIEIQDTYLRKPKAWEWTYKSNTILSMTYSSDGEKVTQTKDFNYYNLSQFPLFKIMEHKFGNKVHDNIEKYIDDLKNTLQWELLKVQGTVPDNFWDLYMRKAQTRLLENIRKYEDLLNWVSYEVKELGNLNKIEPSEKELATLTSPILDKFIALEIAQSAKTTEGKIFLKKQWIETPKKAISKFKPFFISEWSIYDDLIKWLKNKEYDRLSQITFGKWDWKVKYSADFYKTHGNLLIKMDEIRQILIKESELVWMYPLINVVKDTPDEISINTWNPQTYDDWVGWYIVYDNKWNRKVKSVWTGKFTQEDIQNYKNYIDWLVLSENPITNNTREIEAILKPFVWWETTWANIYRWSVYKAMELWARYILRVKNKLYEIWQAPKWDPIAKRANVMDERWIYFMEIKPEDMKETWVEKFLDSRNKQILWDLEDEIKYFKDKISPCDI